MGLLLAFETAPRPASRPAPKRREPAESADIRFFTGVRYEPQGRSQPLQSARAAQRSDGPPVS